jgi:selenocysteine-specific elongation factor
MSRHLILGTAGHIDHGKTSLVKAMSGIDCDRLPEEKTRGITIDIGFAWLDLGDIRLGIVDVPGHERFVKNMLAGATGIDLALLVVAADDAVMPQTREHLDILTLLGLKRGVIALTKCDLVDATTREVAALEIRDLVRGTFLSDSPIVATSATTGEGIAELVEVIRAACMQAALSKSHSESSWFRMAIDRSFTVHGHGTVVTGSVTSGSVRVGEELQWLPSGQRVRVRGLHNHDQAADEVHRGMRAAINLAGVAHDAVVRGQELAAPGCLKPTRTLTVRLRASTEARRPLKHRSPLRLHIGTAEVLGCVSLLDRDTLAPGQWGLAQLFLEEPVTAIWGQPFVVRESSSATTLGGGRILQPNARKIRRRHLELIERVEKLIDGSPRDRVMAVAWFHGPAGFDEADLVREAGIAPGEVAPILADLEVSDLLVNIALGPQRSRLLHADVVRDLEERVTEVVGRLHAEFPLLTVHDRKMVQSRLGYVGDEALVHAIVDRLLGRKMLVGDARRVARADFKPKLSANQRKLMQRVVDAHRVAAFQPPDPAGFANQAGGNAASLGDIFEVAVAEGSLVRIADSLFLHSDAVEEMRRRVVNKLAEGGPGLTVAEIRDLLETTRKYAVPLCEFLDREGVTHRAGDLRVLARKMAKSPAVGGE